MDEDIKIIQNQCGVEESKAKLLLSEANGDISLAIAKYLDPKYVKFVPSHHTDQFAEIRKVLNEKDIKLQKILHH